MKQIADTLFKPEQPTLIIICLTSFENTWGFFVGLFGFNYHQQGWAYRFSPAGVIASIALN
jgi:hypothetical protein